MIDKRFLTNCYKRDIYFVRVPDFRILDRLGPIDTWNIRNRPRDSSWYKYETSIDFDRSEKVILEGWWGKKSQSGDMLLT